MTSPTLSSLRKSHGPQEVKLAQRDLQHHIQNDIGSVHHPIESVLTDRGPVFTGQSDRTYLRTSDVKLEHRVPHSPGSNQRAEVAVRLMKNTANIILEASGLSKSYRNYAVASATRAFNLQLNSNIHTMPYEFHFNRTPRGQLLRAFHTPSMPRFPQQRSTPSASRASAGATAAWIPTATLQLS